MSSLKIQKVSIRGFSSGSEPVHTIELRINNSLGCIQMSHCVRIHVRSSYTVHNGSLVKGLL